MRKITVVAILVCSSSMFSCSNQNAAQNSSSSTATASPQVAVPAAATPNFTVCDGTYALCTTAQCTPSGNDPSTVNCVCEVKKGYSAGSKPCSEVRQGSLSNGEALPSRYHPISSMAVCSISAQWAFCLDSPCTVDKDTSKANCTCIVKQTPDQGYVVVAGTANDAMCTSTIWSSATVHDVIAITGFLYSQNPQLLPPVPIKIVRVETSPQKR